MSVPRLLGIIALSLFIVFVATFFTVLVRLSRVGVTTERYAEIHTPDFSETEPAQTRFDLLGQDPVSGRLIFNVNATIHIDKPPFNILNPGDEVILRIENQIPDNPGLNDLSAVYRNPTGDFLVEFDFGELYMLVPDRRDFYPFDGYSIRFNYAYFIPGDWDDPTGTWYVPGELILRSLTNLIFLTPEYGSTAIGADGYKVLVARLRIIQILASMLILIEVLFLVYLLTIVNMHELLAKGLGYVVAIFIIRTIMVSSAPQSPTLLDYVTLFLICVVFFIMLFKSLGGAEERSIITIPEAWTDTIFGGGKKPNDVSEPVKNDD